MKLTIRFMVDPNVAFTAVRASRGKVVRAEPVSSQVTGDRWFESISLQGRVRCELVQKKRRSFTHKMSPVRSRPAVESKIFEAPPSNQIGFRFWSWVAGMREQSEQYLFGYLAATPVAAQVALMDDRGLPTSPRKWGEVNWARPQPCHRSTARLKRSPERAAGARGSDRPPFRPS